MRAASPDWHRCQGRTPHLQHGDVNRKRCLSESVCTTKYQGARGVEGKQSLYGSNANRFGCLQLKTRSPLFNSWKKNPTATCSNDHVRADLLQPFLCCLRPVQFFHADLRGRPLHQTVQPNVVLQPLQDVWVIVTEDVSSGAAAATDGHARQAHTAAKL